MASRYGSAVAGGPSKLAMMHSQFASLILGSKSLVAYTGFMACTPLQKDDTLAVLTNNGIVTPALGSKVQFNQPKQSTLIGKTWIEIKLTQGLTGASADPNRTLNAFNPAAAWALPTVGAGASNWPRAAYVKNVGDLIVGNHNIVYGNVQLQYIPGIYHAIRRIISTVDVNIEGTNAMVLGALPPSGARVANTIVPAVAQQSTEAVLIDAFYNPLGVTLYVPCEEYFWTHRRDEMHMPESLALEQQIQLTLAQLGDIVVTDTRNDTIITQRPTIESIQMRYEEVTVSATEKENLLKLYATPEGLVQHFLDLELVSQQFVVGTNTRAPGSALGAQPNLIVPISLQSLRMDISDLIIVVQRYSNSSPAQDFPEENGVVGTPFAGSPLESNREVPSLLFEQGPSADPNAAAFQLQGFSTLIELDWFSIKGGTVQLDSAVHTDFWNRSMERKTYFPDARFSEPFYVRSWSQFPLDTKNSSGHISPSTVGNMGVDLQLKNPGNTIRYLVSVFSHCHNAIQTCNGGRGKVLQ